MLPRSPAGILNVGAQGHHDLALSPSSPLTPSHPDLHYGSHHRQSTDSSDALRYYWSSEAGARGSASGSQSSLSLGASPTHTTGGPGVSSSPYSLSPQAASGSHLTRSHVSLQSLVEEEQGRDDSIAAMLINPTTLFTLESAPRDGRGEHGYGSGENRETGGDKTSVNLNSFDNEDFTLDLKPLNLQLDKSMPMPPRPELLHRDSGISTTSGISEPGPSNRKIHVISYSSTSSLTPDTAASGVDDIESSGGGISPWRRNSSDSSQYSLASGHLIQQGDSSLGVDMRAGGNISNTSGGYHTPSRKGSNEPLPTINVPFGYQNYGNGQSSRPPMTESSMVDGSHPESPSTRASFASTSTATGRDTTYSSPLLGHDVKRTPTQPSLFEWPLEPGLSPPAVGGALDSHATPRGGSLGGSGEYHPRNQGNFSGGITNSSGVPFAPASSGKLAFVAPPDISRRSLDALQREVNNLDTHGLQRVDVRVDGESRLNGDSAESERNVPRSAPAVQTEFGGLLQDQRHIQDHHHHTVVDEFGDGNGKDDTVRGRKGTIGSVRPVMNVQDETMLTPQRYDSGGAGGWDKGERERQRERERARATTPTRDVPSKSPARSPEPPPRSELRKMSQTPKSENDHATVLSPIQSVSSPLASPHDLAAPIIAETASSSPGQPVSDTLEVNVTPSKETSSSSSTSAFGAGGLSRSYDLGMGSTSGSGYGSGGPRQSHELASFDQSGTIQHLTEMLGGAIDAIGLIDSRDTPPPMVAEPSKDTAGAGGEKRQHPNFSLILDPAIQTGFGTDRGPITPSTLPLRQASLAQQQQQQQQPSQQFHQHQQSIHPPAALHSASSSMPPPVSGGPLIHSKNNFNQQQLLRRASSILSLRSNNFPSPTFNGISARPWPSAMLFGHIKSLKSAGERSKAYAMSINELARSESGMREWCAAAAIQINRPVSHMSTSRAFNKAAGMTHLGVRGHSNSISISSNSGQSHLGNNNVSSAGGVRGGSGYESRKVSSSSEFPMRADSYAAREISARMLDPSDQPNALPAGLPYPQLQQQVTTGLSGGGGAGGMGGMRPSPSMQSVTSITSRRGFFSAIGRNLGSSKKDSFSLGPPGQGMGISGSVGGVGNGSSSGVAKKDIRGLTISGPTSITDDAASTSRGPMGPRGPRDTFTPPPKIAQTPEKEESRDRDRESIDLPGRTSLDTAFPRGVGMGGMKGRASLDSDRPGLGSGQQQILLGAPASTGNQQQHRVVSDEDIMKMSDVLPHASKGVLRTYLETYGDQVSAITAYIDDEKAGIMKAR